MVKIKKAKYIELVPRNHRKNFENKSDAWKYWQKRFDKFSNFNIGENPKDYFNATIITLNKNGTPRKQTTSRNLTPKQKKKHEKAMKKYYERKKEETLQKTLKRLEIEEELDKYLVKNGFKGKVHIKYFEEIR